MSIALASLAALLCATTVFAQTVRFESPAAGSVVRAGTVDTIRWSGSEPGERMLVGFSADDGRSWRSIHDTTASSTAWIVPNAPTNTARLRLQRLVPESSTLTVPGGPVSLLRASRDGRWLYVVMDGLGALYDAATCTRERILGSVGSSRPDADFGIDTRILATVERDSIVVRALFDGSVIAAFPGAAPVRIHPDGRRVYYHLPGRGLEVRNVVTGESYNLLSFSFEMLGLDISDDAESYMVALPGGTFVLDRFGYTRSSVSSFGLTNAHMDRSGRFIVGTYGLTIYLWDIGGSRAPRTLDGPGHTIESATLSSDGRRVVIGDRGGSAMVFDTRSGLLLHEFSRDFGVSVAEPTADAHGVFIGDVRGFRLQRFERRVGEPITGERFTVDCARFAVSDTVAGNAPVHRLRRFSTGLFVIGNPSNLPLTLRSIVELDGDTADFELESEDLRFLPLAMAQGNRFGARVRFTPTALGRRAARFGVVGDCDTLPVSICAIGTFQPVQQLVEQVTFEGVAVGEELTRVVALLENVDSVAHRVTVDYDDSWRRDTAFEVIEGIGTFVLEPRSRMAMVVRFRRDDAWEKMRLLRCTFEGDGSPVTILLEAPRTHEPPWWSVPPELAASRAPMRAQVTPLPAGGRATLELVVPVSDDVTITLRDALGRVVLTLPPQRLSPGTERIDLPLDDLAPGAYVLVVNGRRVIAVERLVVE